VPKRKAKFFSATLIVQFLLATAFIAAPLSAGVSFAVKYVETERLSKELVERSEQTLKVVSQTSSTAMASNNVPGLELLSQQVLGGVKDICRIRIVTKDGEVLIDQIKPKTGSRVEVTVISRPVIAKSGTIGEISLFWDLDGRLATIEKNAWAVGGYAFMTFALAVFVLLAIANWLVLKPVRRLEKSLKMMAGETSFASADLPGYTAVEFHHFADAINQLHTNIEAQKERENLLMDATAELENVRYQLIQAIEAVTEGFVYYNEDDVLTICNERYRQIYPESADLLQVGNQFEDIIRIGVDRGQYQDAFGREEEWIEKRLEQHRNPQGPIEQELADGRWVQVIETRSVDGGLVGIRSDITEFKKYQRELKHAIKTAEQANEAKSEFLAMMSHEIRTPLNGVMGILGFLDDSELSGEQRQLVNTGQVSATNLLSVINDILDFSKLEAGKVELELVPFDPNTAFESIVDLLQPTAFAKGIDLTLQSKKTEKTLLMGDASRLGQVILNLVGNAIKFTEQGGVNVSIGIEQNDENTRLLICKVTDTGIGVDLDKQSQLFGKFVSVDSSYTRQFGGTGLGLSISKQFIEMMDGEIGFESIPHEGSCFWFHVPLEKVDAADFPNFDLPEEIRPIVLTAAPRVLVAEDNAANQLVARKILEKMGCRVDIVGNGIEAVDAATHFPYDLIFMDISMPEMDGMAATRKIRRLTGKNAEIPIVAMTAHALKGEKEQFLAAGMNDYLQKPVPVRHVQLLVKKWVERKDSDKDTTDGDLNTNIPVLDENILKELGREAGEDMIMELVQCFIDDTSSRTIDIENVIAENNLAALEAQAHSLGSSAGTFGCMQLHHICRDIERLLREGNSSAAQKMTSDLKSTIKESLVQMNLFRGGL
jgi:signal transduction histidine kinase/CheY-like chemotaxis protein/HPt (histidine-containing phosphotransfer) domain-containing protein